MGNRGEWALAYPYDTAGGPSSLFWKPAERTQLTYPRMRILAMVTIRAPSRTADLEPVAAQVRVEQYWDKVRENLAPYTNRHNVVTVPANCLSEVASGDTNTLRAGATKRLFDGQRPVWPRPSDWEEVPPSANDSGGARIWKPVRRLFWRDAGAARVICRLFTQHSAGSSSSRAAYTVVLSVRTVSPPFWVTLPVTTADGQTGARVPPAAGVRAAQLRRLEADFVETMRCSALLPDSYKQAFDWFEKYQVGGVPGGVPPP